MGKERAAMQWDSGTDSLYNGVNKSYSVAWLGLMCLRVDSILGSCSSRCSWWSGGAACLALDSPEYWLRLLREASPSLGTGDQVPCSPGFRISKPQPHVPCSLPVGHSYLGPVKAYARRLANSSFHPSFTLLLVSVRSLWCCWRCTPFAMSCALVLGVPGLRPLKPRRSTARPSWLVEPGPAQFPLDEPGLRRLLFKILTLFCSHF